MKSARLNLRIPEDLNAEIVAAAEAGEYRYVSTWVEEACREKIERDQEGQHPQIPPTIEVAPYPVVTKVTHDTLTIDRGITSPAAAPQGECPRKANHRVGTYCKGCNKVITKGA